MRSTYIIMFVIILGAIILFLSIWGFCSKQKRIKYTLAGINAWFFLMFFLGMTIWHIYINERIAYYIIPTIVMIFAIKTMGFYPKFKKVD
ncbi:hypothetical protein C1I91_19255 [Clostridium manihotivorum]|uniref:Uncharacterized protein n=1 Tax=Clostridium manihotivorum TaxID=2320868 RepID=A0A3R5X3I7_9CLOT|nr:hypothetical protein C1I91_19255 [Clostridium manihotivorum]